jgi:hypothetical protein
MVKIAPSEVYASGGSSLYMEVIFSKEKISELWDWYGYGLSMTVGIAAPVRSKVLMVLRLRAPPFRISCRPYNTSQASTNKIGQDSRWPGWQVVIGIETHAQIKSREKLFSRGSV